MGFNPRLTPISVVSAPMASCATNSSARIPFFIAPAAGQVIAASALNGTTTAVASGTTAGSAATLILAKNGTSTGSRIASFNGSGTAIATQASQALTMSTSTAITRFAKGDTFFFEFVGGAAVGDCAGLKLQADIMYAYGPDDSATI